MQVTTRTTKVHSGTISADELQAVALTVLRKQIGIDDAHLVSSRVVSGPDGSITVEVVEAMPLAELPKDAAEVVKAEAEVAPAVIPGFGPRP